MTTTKIHINIKQGIFEAEGSEEFVERMFGEFKENIKIEKLDGVPIPPSSPTSDSQEASRQSKESPKKTAPKKAKATKTKGGSSEATLVKELDLTGGATKESLRDYCARFVIKTNMERNLVFTYYLQNILEVKGFGVNHIFTCYRNIPNTKIPGNLKQSLYDTSAKGWIAVKSIENDISVPVIGVNYIEHDLPKAGDSVS